jgi:soluble P-type ATPase
MGGKRPSVSSLRGIVAAAHPQAAQAGAAILRDGGNAFDAAAATAAALNVVEPYMSGLAGMGMATCYIAAEQRVRTLDFITRVPSEFPAGRFTDREQLSRGPIATGTPGNLAGWCELVKRYGRKQLADVFAPAIDLARNGFPLTEYNVSAISDTAAEFTLPLPLREGGRGRGPELWFTRPNQSSVRFTFAETLRADAAKTLVRLRSMGMQVHLLSGDHAASVASIASTLGITAWRADYTPVQKVTAVEALVASGRKVLMIGDGLNDSPSLAAATVSASPATAADISQTVADVVFQGDKLVPVAIIIETARRARNAMRQNIALSIGYNFLMVPLAVSGFVTPWLAAVAMSSSSLLVMANSFRLRGGRS